MSAKYHQSVHVHPYPWGQVAAAIFRRYPNPFSSHVLSEDTVDRRLLHSGSTLYSRRFVTKTNRLPKWGEAFFLQHVRARYVPLVEESLVDTEARVVVTYTRNVGLSRFMTAVERVRYSEHPDSPGEATVAVKEAWIESGLYGLRSAVKSFGMERFRQNCTRATEGFNHVLAGLAAQGGQQGGMMMEKVRGRARRAADVARAHSTLHADQVGRGKTTTTTTTGKEEAGGQS